MTRWTISSKSKFEELGGYSRAVVDGEWIFVSGTAGYDPVSMAFPDDVADQTRLALKTIADALGQAGATLDDIVRVRVYVADREYVGRVSAVLGQTFAKTRPANTTIICSLPAAEIKVEIEVTALKRGGAKQSAD